MSSCDLLSLHSPLLVQMLQRRHRTTRRQSGELIAPRSLGPRGMHLRHNATAQMGRHGTQRYEREFGRVRFQGPEANLDAAIARLESEQSKAADPNAADRKATEKRPA